MDRRAWQFQCIGSHKVGRDGSDQAASAMRSNNFPGGSVKRIHLPGQEMQVRSLGREDPLQKEMATCSSILSWEIPWTEESRGL